MTRAFGRKYVIQWDTFDGRYRVVLGHETIGFHKNDEGARALAVEHASHSFALGSIQPYVISFDAGETPVT